MRKQFLTGLKFLALMIIITGILYPGMVTIVTNIFLSKKAHGSLIEKDGLIIGSELIGQNFESQKYFWSRPSVVNYNPLPSGGSNLGHLNPALRNTIVDRRSNFMKINKLQEDKKVPSEMITASASGLDPHISPADALMQVERISIARGMDREQQDQLVKIIHDLTEKPQFSILGESRINVFSLNLMLDNLE
jgi:K+-transporting ATPase ATPase C chain